MSNSNRSSSSGISAGFLLFLVFLVLKLCHVIDWSWWWVTAPLWIGLLVGIAIAALFGFCAFVAWLFSRR